MYLLRMSVMMILSSLAIAATHTKHTVKVVTTDCWGAPIRTSVSLKSASGTLRRSGLGGVDVELIRGTYDIEIEAEGFLTERRVEPIDRSRSIQFCLNVAPISGLERPQCSLNVTVDGLSEIRSPRVIVEGLYSGSHEERLSPPSGRLEFQRLRPGRYRVKLLMEEDVIATREVDLREFRPVEIRMPLR